tara:strand:+ start:403 stop:762 length:360 start_codon:yes stop_codon:yes gene_type:complete
VLSTDTHARGKAVVPTDQCEKGTTVAADDADRLSALGNVTVDNDVKEIELRLPVSMDTHNSCVQRLLDTSTARELKDACRGYGLSPNGTKQNLAARIVKHEQSCDVDVVTSDPSVLVVP